MGRRKYSEDERKQNELIATNMKRFREERGMSQPKAAVYLQVAVDTLRKYEQALRTPRMVELNRIARLYGHTVDHFLLENPPPAELHIMPVETIEAMFLPKLADGVEFDAQLQKKLHEFVHDMANVQREIWLRKAKAKQEKKKKGKK